jgi:O-antigen ligase
MMTSDRSAGLRLVMWENAWALIQENPIFGHGIISELSATAEKPSGENHPHVHNMYLSWLIWGGVFSLASGILFLLAIAATIAFGKISNRPFFGAVAVCVPWVLSMVFDSFLVWPNFLTSFVVINSIGYGLLTSRE